MSAAFEAARAVTAGGWQELAWIEPEAAFRALRAEHPAFLDSRGAVGQRSRFSLLGWRPFRRLHGAGGHVFLDGAAVAGDAFAVLAAELAKVKQEFRPHPVPFPTGVAIGFLGYELASPFHPAPAHARPAGIPDVAFGFYRNLLALDRAHRRAWITCADAITQREALGRLRRPPPSHDIRELQWNAGAGRDVHEARVRRAREYIAAGDIYQANITASRVAPRPPELDPADLYLKLAAASPAPFGGYVVAGPGCAIASASPERLVQVSADGRIEARPIKGTRPRGATPHADAALAHELVGSAKDRAENLMIVDLLRHDIGRVAVTGSVRVPALCALESFAHVHHLVSTVQGVLRPELGPIDVLAALHPGGSVTGAPKRRAMEIIAGIEPGARGPYCGALAWIGFDGAMDASILIRTVVVGSDAIYAHAGGGIVADSDPADEYDEMMVKLGPLLRALGRHDDR